MTEPDPGRPEPPPGASAEDIGADIEATRTELGQTVEALSAKLDVKAQLKHEVEDAKNLVAEKGSAVSARVVDVATDDTGSVRPVIPVAALAAVAIIVAAVLWRRRR
jgi:MYXO-CTERM domain-containing protein